MPADNGGLMIRAIFDAASRSAGGEELSIPGARGDSDIHDLRAVLCAPCRASRGITTAPVRLG